MRTPQEPVSTAEQDEITRILGAWGGVDRPIHSHRAPRPVWQAKPVKTLSAFALALTASLGGAANVHARSETTPVVGLTAAPLIDYADGLSDTSALENPENTAIDRIIEPPATRSERTSSTPARARAAAQRATTRWVAPLTNYVVTSCYGVRWGTLHSGVDLAAPNGTPIRSVGAGVVVQAGWDINGYGFSVIVQHADGWSTLYAHASQVLVRVGQRVAAGTKIALVGSTGYSTGPHLHISVGRGDVWRTVLNSLRDPITWLAARGIHLDGC